MLPALVLGLPRLNPNITTQIHWLRTCVLSSVVSNLGFACS